MLNLRLVLGYLRRIVHSQQISAGQISVCGEISSVIEFFYQGFALKSIHADKIERETAIHTEWKQIECIS